MESRLAAELVLLAVLAAGGARAQVIEFESGGLKYKTLTKNGVTVMFAHLPTHVRDYSILQVAVSNGSSIPWAIKPEDFFYHRQDGQVLRALPAPAVVNSMIEKASRSDVIKLVATYESTLYGIARFHSTNGYESRRENALAELGSAKLKAAAAASAIVLVATKLGPGQSTDGAVFYPTAGKPLGPGTLVVDAAGARFEFETDDDFPPPKGSGSGIR